MRLIFSDLGGTDKTIDIAPGEAIFIVGANGVGKSSLMHRLHTSGAAPVKRILAHRQMTFKSNAVELTPASKEEHAGYVKNFDYQALSRYRDEYAPTRNSMTIFDIVDKEATQDRSVARAVRSGEIGDAEKLGAIASPLQEITKLFKNSNIPLDIYVEEGQKIMARKAGGEPYSISKLSDGERNALLVSADVLTAEAGCLILIDEPERHIHRSITAPLLSNLFALRPDCSFIISTHDIDLTVMNPKSRVILLRECKYAGDDAVGWDGDILNTGLDIEDQLKQDIFGARRKILFVEGTRSSLDEPLYSIIFPGVSVIPKASSRDVRDAVGGVRSASDQHWVKAWGIVDGDAYDAGTVEKLKSVGVYALPFYAVESIYFHSMIVRAAAEAFCKLTGGNAEERSRNAIGKALECLKNKVEFIALKSADKEIRRMIFDILPTRDSIKDGKNINLQVDVAKTLDTSKALIEINIKEGKWDDILQKVSLKETGCIAIIVSELGFKRREQYEQAVLNVLSKSSDLRSEIKKFFGDLNEMIDQ